jgi:hypothetical protein
MKLKIMLFLVGVVPTFLYAAEQWQIATQSEAINFGQKISISIVKLEEATDWPSLFKMKLSAITFRCFY